MAHAADAPAHHCVFPLGGFFAVFALLIAAIADSHSLAAYLSLFCGQSDSLRKEKEGDGTEGESETEGKVH